MKATKAPRERKNGASREAWQKRKREANTVRKPQTVEYVASGSVRRFREK